MTFDTWTEPVVPSPWFLLVLPTAYLIIGAARRRLRERRDLALQLAGLTGRTALALVAVTVDEGPPRWLVAAGRLAHALWGVAHHRTGRVVPRGYAERCGVFDTIIGIPSSCPVEPPGRAGREPGPGRDRTRSRPGPTPRRRPGVPVAGARRRW